MTEMDQATREAVAALTYRLQKRDESAEEDRADAEPFALEFLMALRMRGWRPTPAQAAASWAPPIRRGGDPAKHADELAAARQACAAGTAKLRAAESEATP